jgi:hypothetical protein
MVQATGLDGRALSSGNAEQDYIAASRWPNTHIASEIDAG